jgi:hypothetical protein
MSVKGNKIVANRHEAYITRTNFDPTALNRIQKRIDDNLPAGYTISFRNTFSNKRNAERVQELELRGNQLRRKIIILNVHIEFH